MATLTANITADDEILPVSAEIVSGDYTIDSEAIHVYGTSRGAQGRAFDRLFVSVERGIGGTTKATHTSGATLTRYYPGAPGGGGGGVTVDNTVDAPFAATTLIAPGATESGADEATLPTTLVTYQATVVLTDAQVKALPTTSVMVAAAPGASKVNHILQAFVAPQTDPAWVPYTNINAGGILNVGLDNNLSGQPSNPISFPNDAGESLTLLDDILDEGRRVTATPYFEVSSAWGPVNTPFGDENEMIVVNIDNGGGGDLTGGDPANTLTVTVTYLIVDV